jgi:hypothetical protein
MDTKTQLESLGLGPLEIFLGPEWLKPFLGTPGVWIERAITIWEQFFH